MAPLVANLFPKYLASFASRSYFVGQMRPTLILPTLFNLAVLLAVLPVRFFLHACPLEKIRTDITSVVSFLVRTCGCLPKSSQEPQT